MGLHGGGSKDFGLDAFGLDEHFEGKGVYDRCKHSHLVSVHSVEAFTHALQAAEDVAAAIDYGYLEAGFCCRSHLFCIFFQPLGIKAFAGGAAEAFSGEFKKDAFIHIIRF